MHACGRSFLLIALLVLGGATLVSGEQAVSLAERAAEIDRASTAPDGFRVVVGHMSLELSIDVDTLRAQRAKTGLGWGDLLIAHHLAHQNDLTFEQVVAEFRTGKTWEDVVRGHDGDLVRLTTRIEQAEDAIDRRADDRAPPTIGQRTPAPGSDTATGRRRR